MSAFFTSGQVVDLALALVVLEAFGLALYRHRTGRGPLPSHLAGFLIAGVLLMLALRAALVDAGWGWIAAYLVAALIAHIVDLRQRWQF